MKWIVYNLLFAVVYPFLLPGFLLRMLRRGGYAARMGDRFALYPPGLFGKNRPLFDSHASQSINQQSNTSPVWIHAVSVGEVQVAGQLMREWRKADPSVRFCFSTTSSTGWKMAERELDVEVEKRGGGGDEGGGGEKRWTADGDVLIYNPLDFPNFVKSALRTVRPRAIVLTESEIWPNFILTAKKMGIPIFLINARVSDRSAPRYRFARFFFRDVLSAFTRIFAQSDLDKERLVAAGAPADIVDVTGSFKFDVARRNEAKERELSAWIRGDEVERRGGDVGGGVDVGVDVGVGGCVGGGGQRGGKILLGGSTWPGEDEVLLKIYRKLIDDPTTVHLFSPPPPSSPPPPHPILVLAPRHFEKADAVEANIRKAGFECVRRSCQSNNPTIQQSNNQPSIPPVFLADTTGELMGLYGIADVVFVGKSLCAHGSQNMIEPCLCGKPTLVGPYTENFRPVMSDLLSAGAIIQVKDAAELEEKIVAFVSESAGDRVRDVRASVVMDPASDLGERAAAVVKRRCGVVRRCVEAIRRSLEIGNDRRTSHTAVF